MQRRHFIALIVSAGMSLLGTAGAQQPQKMKRVGMLLALDESDPMGKSRVQAFRQGMRDLGWIDGRNAQIEPRYVGSNSQLINKHVAELIRVPPDVIVANSSPVMGVLRQATSTIPIVFTVVNDPVGQKFISNLAQPGGNVTGFYSVASSGAPSCTRRSCCRLR